MSLRDAMDDAFAAQDIGGFAKVIAHVSLRANPIKITANAFCETNLWFVASGSDSFRATGEMTHFPRSEFALGLRRDTNAERVGDLLRRFADRNALATADIYRQAIKLVRLGDEEVGARYILDEREVARLFAVLVQNRCEIIEQARAENCDHTGVGIENGLARTVSAGITERDRRDAALF